MYVGYPLINEDQIPKYSTQHHGKPTKTKQTDETQQCHLRMSTALKNSRITDFITIVSFNGRKWMVSWSIFNT